MPYINKNRVVKRNFKNSTYTFSSFYTGVSHSYTSCTLAVDKKNGFSNNSPRVNSKLILKTNPYVLDKTSERSTPQVTRRETDNYWYMPPGYPYYSRVSRTRYLDFGNKTYYPTLGVSQAEYSATASFYSEVAAAKVNLALAFAERQKTIDLLARTARDLVKVIRHLRKGNISKAAKVLKVKKSSTRFDDLASRWLELQYGWQPLYNDIYGAMIATVPRPVRVPIRVSRSSTEEHKSNTTSYFKSCTVNRTYTIKTFADVSGPAIAQASELGLTNPAILAWELVPFSFVADWFIPIGSWLEAQTALLGITLSDSSITRTEKYQYTVRGNYLPKDTNADTYSVTQGYNTGHRTVKHRVVGVVPPLHPPRWKNPLSVKHALSALALLHVTVNKHR